MTKTSLHVALDAPRTATSAADWHLSSTLSEEQRLTLVRRWPMLGTILISLILGASQSGRLLPGLLTEPIKAELGLSDTQIGILTGVAIGVAYSVFLVPSAWLVDRLNRRACLILFGTLNVVATLLTAVASGFWQLFVARILVGGAEASLLSLAVSLIADMLPPLRRPMGFAVFTACGTMMIFINFIVAGQIASASSWRSVFVYFAIGYSVLIAVSAFVLRDPGRSGSGKPDPLRQVLRILLANPSFIFLVLLACLYVFGIMAVLTWLPAILIRTHHFSASEAANYMAVSIGVLAGATTLTSGMLLARARRKSVGGPLRISMWVALAALILFPAGLLGQGAPALIVLAAAIAIAPIVNSAIMSSVQEIAGPSYRATATALLLIPDSLIGGGAGTFLTGLISDAGKSHFGDQSIQYALLIVLLIAWGVAAILYRTVARRIDRDVSL